MNSQTAVIAGVDEAGRGSLAGPVVAAACVVDDSQLRDDLLVTDSKQMTEDQRNEAFLFLTEQYPHGVGIVEADVIDAIGILAATEQAMQTAVAELSNHITPTYLLVDGRDAFWFDYPHSSIIRGDEQELCIAAASIIAKVTRDRLMVEYDEQFPGYGFGQHKGYGTEYHQEMLLKKGVSSLHRTTFLSKIVTV